MNYQTTLFLGTAITLVFIVLAVIRTKMNLKYAIVWILWGFVMLVLSSYPGIIDKLSYSIGISIPANTVFLIFIFLLYVMCFYLFIKISTLTSEIKNLIYSVSVLKKKIEEYDEK